MPRYTASTLEQAQAGGGIAWAINQVDQLGRAGASSYIREAFPDMGNAEIRRILDYSERAINVANQLELGTGETLPSARAIPRNTLLPSDCQYEYYFEASWPTADPKVTGGFRVRVCSDSRLTYNEAVAEALDQLLENVTGNDTPGYDKGPGSVDDISWNLISIQQRG